MDAFTGSDSSHTSDSLNNVDNNILNELLAVLVDSKDFFEQAEKLVLDGEINILFKHYATNREEAKEYIKNLIVARRGTPNDHGTLSGELRKLYTEFMVMLNEDSSRLLEQMIYHEIRNAELLELLIDSAQTTFIASMVEQTRKDITSTITHLQGVLVKITQDE